jgi:hypothetical protein
MAKKYLLAGAIAAFLAAASIAYAPVNLMKFPLAKPMPIVFENSLEKFAGENEKRLKSIEEEMRLAETDGIYSTILMAYLQLQKDIPPYLTKKFLRQIVRFESSDYWKAVGPDGERGYTQMTKEAWYEVSKENFEKNAFIPKKNITASIKYFLLIDDFWRRNYPSWQELPDAEKIRTFVASYNGGKENLFAVNRNISKMRPITKRYVKNINNVMDSILSEI